MLLIKHREQRSPGELRAPTGDAARGEIILVGVVGFEPTT